MKTTTNEKSYHFPYIEENPENKHKGSKHYYQKRTGDLAYLRLCPVFVQRDICKCEEGVEDPLAPNWDFVFDFIWGGRRAWKGIQNRRTFSRCNERLFGFVVLVSSPMWVQVHWASGYNTDPQGWGEPENWLCSHVPRARCWPLAADHTQNCRVWEKGLPMFTCLPDSADPCYNTSLNSSSNKKSWPGVPCLSHPGCPQHSASYFPPSLYYQNYLSTFPQGAPPCQIGLHSLSGKNMECLLRPDTALSPGVTLCWWLLELTYFYPIPVSLTSSVPGSLIYLISSLLLIAFALSSCPLSRLFPALGLSSQSLISYSFASVFFSLCVWILFSAFSSSLSGTVCISYLLLCNKLSFEA